MRLRTATLVSIALFSLSPLPLAITVTKWPNLRTLRNWPKLGKDVSQLSKARGKAILAMKSCGPTGDATDPQTKVLNKLKNQYKVPTSLDGSCKTLQDMLNASQDSAFDNTEGAEITGWVKDVKVGGIETCNCHAKDPSERDTHIELVPDGSNPDPNAKDMVVVEVTPRTRMLAAKGLLTTRNDIGTDWSTDNLKQLIGKQVRFKGWLTYDFEHMNEAWNVDANDSIGRANWRGTCWELHPVTAILNP